MADGDPSGSITISKRAIRWTLLVGVLVVVVGGSAYALGRHSSSPSSGSTTPATTRTFTIPSGAMEPTLKIGDSVTVQSLGSGESLDRGAIIVFSRPPAEKCGGPIVNDLVKRIIGLPGETISLSGGYVYINGKRLNETWLPAPEQGITVAGPAGNNANFDVPLLSPLRRLLRYGRQPNRFVRQQVLGSGRGVPDRGQGRPLRIGPLLVVTAAVIGVAACSSSPSEPSSAPLTSAAATAPSTTTTAVPPTADQTATVQAGCKGLTAVNTAFSNGSGAIERMVDGSGSAGAAWAAVTDMDGVGGAEYRAIFRDTHVLLNDYRSSENGGDLSDAEADIGDLQTDCQNVGQ